MKILCLQLARFGDIYQTWPVLNALHRLNPEVEIHLLVRERFAAATVGLESIAKVKCLPTKAIFAPLLSTQPNVAAALDEIDDLIDGLKSEQYDKILNLSFSPASSYLVDSLTEAHTSVAGYTRHSDGFLCIPDDPSSYFYAQVGLDRANRIHLTDLFALIAGVELSDADFYHPPRAKPSFLPEDYIVIHVGASETAKACSREIWHDITSRLLNDYEGHVVFIGSAQEAGQVPKGLNPHRLIDQVGQTELVDLFSILKGARALIACDSVALHMASLTGTPTLNISFAAVRFWETGPRAKGSRVLWYETQTSLDCEQVIQEFKRLITNQPPGAFSIEKTETMGVLYRLHGYHEDDFSWELIQALYMNHPFPMTGSQTIQLGFTRLAELAVLGLEQVDVIQDIQRRNLAVSLLNEIDALVDQVGKWVPELGPVVRWFQSEKLRIGPAGLDEVISATRSVFEKLRDICQMYQLHRTFNESLPREDLTWKA